MKHLDTIRWNLYCLEGWEMANLKLTTLFNKELQNIHLPENSEPTQVWDAAKILWQKMINHFKTPDFAPFGTSDSDVEMALREAIKQTLGVWLDEHITCQR